MPFIYSLCPEFPALIEDVTCLANPALYHWPVTRLQGMLPCQEITLLRQI